MLHSVGDPGFIGRARKVSLQPCGIWSEQVRGTNAIGTALVTQSPIVVHNVEHFVSSNHFLTCSASPIFDPHGRILGILDVSGDSRAQQQHTLALVRISAQQIENQMFTSGFEQEVVLHFHKDGFDLMYNFSVQLQYSMSCRAFIYLLHECLVGNFYMLI